MSTEETLAFFASVIKSGEPWSIRCAQALNDAFVGLRALKAENAKLRAALWGFAYACEPGEKFCAGCDLDGFTRENAPEEEHDADCRAARAALKETP